MAKKTNEIDTKLTEYLQNIKDHYMPKWEAIKKHLAEVKDPYEKIKYLQEQELDYSDEVLSDVSVFYSSGSHIAHTYPHKLGMDQKIETEIKRIQLHYGLNDCSSKLNPNQETPPHNGTEPLNTFKYNTPNQQNHIEDILNKLKHDSEFIIDEVKLTDFKKTFNNIPLNKISPIEWQKSIASLRYFVKQFPFEMSDISKFKIAAYCFTQNGKKLNYSQIKNAKQPSPKHTAAIDNILKLYPFIK